MTNFIRNLRFCQNFIKFRQNAKASLCTNALEKEDDLEVPSIIYSSSSSQYKIGRKYAAEKLQQLFNLKPAEAIEAALRFNKLSKVMSKTITNNYKLLQKEHVSHESILNHLDVLAEPKLKVKIKLLKSLSLPFSQSFPLLLMCIEDIEQFLDMNALDKKYSKNGRIMYMATLFDISVYEVAEALLRKPFLRKINLGKLKQKIDFLLGYGITLEEITNDYWILLYNKELIRERIQFAKHCNIDKVKTWMVRAPVGTLNKYVQRRSDNKQILGEATLAEYLSDRLECKLEVAKSILGKHPALFHKHMTKMKEIIDFLYGENFTPMHIVRNPKILLHSVETTAKRLKELKGLDLKLDSLYMLTKSRKQYLNHYENLLKTKGKIKENTSTYTVVLLFFNHDVELKYIYNIVAETLAC